MQLACLPCPANPPLSGTALRPVPSGAFLVFLLAPRTASNPRPVACLATGSISQIKWQIGYLLKILQSKSFEIRSPRRSPI